MKDRPSEWRLWGLAAWVLVIAGFALLHAAHLRADFPNGSPWVFDWAKYTDEGWYGNAAVRAHLFGNWYVAGDFNPAVAVPVWPFAEWVLFFFTGVSVQAARGLAIACFFANLSLTYFLLRASGTNSEPTGQNLYAGTPSFPSTEGKLSAETPVWMGLAAVTLAVTSPYIYGFSRLAILEPMQTTLTLGALNLAVRLPAMRRKKLASAGVGLLFALVVLTKTTGLFLFPAVVWAMVVALKRTPRQALVCAGVATGTAAIAYGAWLALVGASGLWVDYKYYFFVNDYPKPSEIYWPLVSFWWSLHGLFWVDHSLILLAGAIALCAVVAWRSGWGRRLWGEPLFGASLWAVAGYVLFMTLQDHPQPRYFAVPAFFCFFVLALGAGALLNEGGWKRGLGWVVVALASGAACVHGVQTIRYAMHPEYTYMNAAAELTQYIDAHPNGKRLLVSISGDEITLLTHLPSLCDDFGTEDLPVKTAAYQPGWYATWNDLDPGTLVDLHVHFSLQQTATFHALDDPDRNLLVLFKLHPLPNGQMRDWGNPEMKNALPGDEIEVPID